jgi:hypothetical protein
MKGLNIKGECEEETDTHTCSLEDTMEEKEAEVKPDQTSDPQPSKNNITPNRPVKSSKDMVAPDAPPAPDEDAILSRVWARYLAATGKNPKINTLTPARRKLGKARLSECLKKTTNPENAEKLMCAAIDALAKSDWNMGRDPKTNGQCYNDWERNLFKSYETMERLWNR